jgi:hypothetical protein
MDLGQQIDDLYALRAKRLELEKTLTELKSNEAELKAMLIEALKEGGLEGAKGQTATASLQYKVTPNVTDWEAVYAFIQSQGMFELLHKRITTTLWTALRDDGVTVPGTEPIALVDLSLTKSKR